MPGTAVHIRIAMMAASTSGITYLTSCSNLIPAIVAAMYRSSPTGGVAIPSESVIHTITPKYTGSIPSDVATGRSTGVIISTDAQHSMKHPMNRRSSMVSAMKINFELDTAANHAPIDAVIPCMLRNHVNAPAHPIIRSTSDELAAVSMSSFPISLKLSSLYINVPAKSPYADATAPASVGVKIPEYIPPRIIIGTKRAHIESLNASHTSCESNLTLLSSPKAYFLQMIAVTTISIAA